MTINPTTASIGANDPMFDSTTALGNTRSLTTGDMYEYVATLLGDIDSQMLLFKDQAEAKVKRADEEREFQALLRSLTNQDGKITIAAGSEAEGALIKAYDATDNENIRGAIRGLIGEPISRITQVAMLQAASRSTDPVAAQQAQNQLAALSKTIDENSVSELLADSNNRLSSLSGENELTMMELNGLMQRRSQIIMFSSQTLAQLDQTAKTVIQNMRA
jgi:hypothetical protein